jgi:hypothetical protein
MGGIFTNTQYNVYSIKLIFINLVVFFDIIFTRINI